MNIARIILIAVVLLGPAIYGMYKAFMIADVINPTNFLLLYISFILTRIHLYGISAGK